MWEAEHEEIERLQGKINIDALIARASDLRQGMPCSVPPFQYERAKRSSVMGGMNYHIEIEFEDGIKWLARIRRFNATSPPAALRDYIFKSEIATLMFLEKTAVPSPRVLGYALEGPDNPVGVSYMLIEKLAGSSLRWSIATVEQRTKVIEQVADIFIELQRFPFDKMGSIQNPGSQHIGPFARESLTRFDGSDMKTLGPYSSLEEYHTNSLRLVLDLILREEMYSERPIDAYLIHRFLLDLVPTMIDHSKESGKFFLKHADDKGDHILVDSEYNITGIIDWQWAFTAPEAIAFNSPVGFLPVSDFYDGIEDIGVEEVLFARVFEEKEYTSLADIVRRGRLEHRFAFCNGYDLADWSGFQGLFQGLFRGLRDLIGVDAGMDWDEWKEVALKRYCDDSGLKSLLLKASR